MHASNCAAVITKRLEYISQQRGTMLVPAPPVLWSPATPYNPYSISNVCYPVIITASTTNICSKIIAATPALNQRFRCAADVGQTAN
jgi:hypothetical protein